MKFNEIMLGTSEATVEESRFRALHTEIKIGRAHV